MKTIEKRIEKRSFQKRLTTLGPLVIIQSIESRDTKKLI